MLIFRLTFLIRTIYHQKAKKPSTYKVHRQQHNTHMSVRTLHQQSNRCTLMASDLNRNLKVSRAAETSVIELNQDYISTRGRRRGPRAMNTAQIQQHPTQQHERLSRPEEDDVMRDYSPVQSSNTFRPNFTLPPSTQRRASPDSATRRAATPHPRKAMLPRSGSPKISQQPTLSFRAAGLVAGAGCKWNREDYKHQLHLNWLERS